MTEKTKTTKLLIGSHRSFTGEPSEGIISKLLVPFKRRQTKTLIEQYESGVRLFDFHIKWNKKFKKFYPSDGNWKTGRTLLQSFGELNNEAAANKDKVYYILTLDNELEINEQDSAEYLDIMSKFNTLSNSLNTFYRNLDIIEKRITKKRTLLEKLHNEENIIRIWRDEENIDIKYEYDTLKCPLPLCSNWFLKNIWNFRKKQKREINDSLHIVKDFI